MPEEAKKKPIHAGHRARMRQKLAAFGTEGFADHEILEMLLYYAVPRGDTNETAHLLLREFGGLRGVLEASAEDLKNIAGIGEVSATLFALMRECSRRYHSARVVKRLCLRDTHAIGTFIAPLFIGRSEEQVYLLCLDGKKTPILGKFIASGNTDEALVNVTSIVSDALAVQAKYVVLAHNHPSGFALPSEADIMSTLRLKRTLSEVGITLLDHLIIADPTTPDEPAGDYISFADSRLL